MLHLCQLVISSIISEHFLLCSNRKAKLIFFYEWEISMEWMGSLSDGDEIIKGKIKIPNLSEENEPEEITVSFKIIIINNIIYTGWHDSAN